MCNQIESFGGQIVRTARCRDPQCSDFWSARRLRESYQGDKVYPPDRMYPPKDHMYFWPDIGVWRDVPPTGGATIAVPKAELARRDYPILETPYPELLPPAKPNRRDHPTLLEIAQRDAEIEKWDSDKRNGKRLSGWAGMIFLPIPLLLMGGGAYNSNALMIIFGLVAFFLVAFAFWCVGPVADDARPKPLELVPFNKKENQYLLYRQSSEGEREHFRAVCACPGCGDVVAHPMRKPQGQWEPEWAQVIRVCDTCKREWAQG